MAKIHVFFLFSLLFMFTSVHSYGGNSSKRESFMQRSGIFAGGVCIGLSFSQIDGDAFKGYDKLGYDLGGIMHIKMFENLSIGTELIYAKKGSRLPKNETPFMTSNGNIYNAYSITLDYAELGVSVNFFDNNTNNIGIGFLYGRLVNSRELMSNIVQTDYPFQSSIVDFFIKGNLKLKDKLFAGFKFESSLTPVRKNYYGQLGYPEQRNKQILLCTSYIF